MRPARRFAPALACLLLLAPGCGKDQGKTKAPGVEAGSRGRQTGNVLRYPAEPVALRQTTHYELKISGGGQFGEAKADVVGTLRLEPQGDDKIVARWKIDDVKSLELSGALEPKAEDGQPPPPDVKKVLLERGTGQFVTNRRGDPDEDATKALPENEAKRKEHEARRKKLEAVGKDEAKRKDPEVQKLLQAAAEDQALGLFAGVFQLFTLPEAGLEPGKPVTVEKEEEVDLPTGTKLPMEQETVYELVRIDDSGGARIAEVTVEVEASGAVEFQGGMLVVDQSTDATLLFDLDHGVPVSVEIETGQSFSVGEQGQEVSTIVRSEFEPISAS